MDNQESFHSLLDICSIEKNLHTAFHIETFEKFNIPTSSTPVIDQELPKKKGYDDLNILKIKSLTKTLSSFYPTLSTQKIGLFTYVMEGLGDYAIQKKLYKLLSKKFASHDIFCITLINEKYKSYVKPFSKNHYFVFYQGIKAPKPQSFSKKVLHIFDKLDLICMVPTAYPYLKDLLTHYTSFQGAVEGLGEYGFYHSKAFHPNSNYYSLGAHFLELGLVFEEQNPKNYQDLYSFSNKETLKYLVNSDHLDETALNTYFHKHKLYFSYFQTQQCFELYLKLLLELNQDSTKTLDLVSTDLAGYLKVLASFISSGNLSSVKSFEIFFDNKICKQQINSEGLSLRFIHLGRLSEEEFLTFLNLSEEPCGVRGNTSITDAIYLEKGFIYDCPKHCLNFLYSLIDIIKNRIHSHEILLPVFESFLPGYDLSSSLKALTKAFSDPEYKKALKEFRLNLLRYHDARINIPAFLSRSLFHKRYPDVKNYENALLKQYTDEDIDLEQLFTLLNRKIKQLSPYK